MWTVPIDVPLLPAPRLPTIGTSERPPVAAAAEWPLARAEPSLMPPSAERVHTSPVPRATRSHLALALFTVWLLGGAACAIRVMGDWRSTQRLRQNCEPLHDQGLLDCCADLRRRLRLRRSPQVVVADRAVSPLLIGLLRPAIVLPATWVTDCTSEELRLMLAHELAHLRRRDL